MKPLTAHPDKRARLAASISIVVLALIVALGVCPPVAQASQAGGGTILKWKQMDNCSKQAQIAFPDYTPEANAKRNAKLRECLNGSNLPPRMPGDSAPAPR